MTDPTDAPPPPGGSSSSSSPMAIVSALMGGIGLLLTLLGCVGGGVTMCPGSLFCAVGLGLGLLEYRKARSGQSPPENESIAMIGAGTGGAGCAINGCLWLFTAALIVFTGVFFLVAAIAGNM